MAKKWEIAGSLLLLAVFVAPVLSLAGSETKIYVDDDASGTMDGSSSNPYDTIGKALSHADENTEVHIRKGTYKENIEIPKGVEVYGSDEDDVTIKADDDNDPVVKMNHKTKINKVTIRDGKYGITVGKDDRASIIKCIIKKNDKDGIIIRPADTNDKYIVNISESEIKDNGRAGIYSEKRKLSLIENSIIDNDSDGVDLEAGAEAWIKGNKIKNNNGSGLKLTLDKSEIWTKSNTYYGNDHEGLEVNAYGEAGRIDIRKSKFYKNDRYGIAKIQRGEFASSIWDGFTVQSDVIFWENKIGIISNIIKL